MQRAVGVTCPPERIQAPLGLEYQKLKYIYRAKLAQTIFQASDEPSRHIKLRDIPIMAIDQLRLLVGACIAGKNDCTLRDLRLVFLDGSLRYSIQLSNSFR
jgi:hypothetical protein